MRTYVIKFTKPGKEWKKQVQGTEFLNDATRYCLEFHADGLFQAIKTWWRVFTKKQFTFERGL